MSKSPAIRKKQMTLDMGQKRLGPSACHECGMIYNLDDRQDIEVHSKYHKQQESILKFTGWKNERVVHEYLNIGRCIVIESDIDPKVQLTKALNLLNYVDKQLGIRNALSNILDDIDNKLARAAGHIPQIPSTNEGNSCKYYLFINFSNRIVGFCLAEHLNNKVYKIRKINDENDEKNTHQAVICGISRIWVDKGSRRMKIASKMLDCVRDNFLYFQSLNLNQIAFSDPTENGKQFATKYFKSNEFYIYFK